MSWQSKHKNTPGIEIFFPRGVYVCQVSTHEPRADALYCLLTQTVHSLMVREKSADASQAPPRYAWQQMSASQPLVFPFTHYIITYHSYTFP